MTRVAALFALVVSVAPFPGAQAPVEKPDYETIGRSRDERAGQKLSSASCHWFS